MSFNKGFVGIRRRCAVGLKIRGILGVNRAIIDKSKSIPKEGYKDIFNKTEKNKKELLL